MPAPSDHDLLPLIRAQEKRIRSKYVEQPNGCWLWQAGKAAHGYGSISLSMGGGKWRSVRAHRALFMLEYNRPIREGLTIHHRCGDRACVNPGHLVELTQADNVAADVGRGVIDRLRLARTRG